MKYAIDSSYHHINQANYDEIKAIEKEHEVEFVRWYDEIKAIEKEHEVEFVRWYRYVVDGQPDNKKNLTKNEVEFARDNNLSIGLVNVCNYSSPYEPRVRAKAVVARLEEQVEQVTALNIKDMDMFVWLDIEMFIDGDRSYPLANPAFIEQWVESVSTSKLAIAPGLYMPSYRFHPKQWMFDKSILDIAKFWIAYYPFQQQKHIDAGSSTFRTHLCDERTTTNHNNILRLPNGNMPEMWQFLGNCYGKKYDFNVMLEAT